MKSAFLLLVMAVLGGQQDGRPPWISFAAKEDIAYKYYVGSVKGVTSEAKGFEKAREVATEQAILENYGVITQVGVNAKETLQYEALSKKSRALSQNVRLIGFERVSYHLESSEEGKQDLWVLFRYPKRQILAEQKRLSRETWEAADSNDVDLPASKRIVMSNPNKCTGPLPGIWFGVTIPDKIGMTPTCTFTYLGLGGCESHGTYTVPSGHSGTVNVDIFSATGGNCLPPGKYGCDFYIHPTFLSFDCGVGKFIYRKIEG